MAIRNTFLTTMKIVFSQSLLTLILLPSLSLALPLEYTASYNIGKYGMDIAKSNYSLRYENNGVRMMQHTETIGLAALLRNDTLDESSFLSFQDNQLLLTEFSHKQKPSGKKNRDIQLKIDWVQSDNKLLGMVSGSAGGKKLEYKVNKPVWDTNSYLIPLMLNTKEKAQPQQYTMMIKGEFKTYSFITHGSEKIEVSGQTVQAIKIERDGSINKNPIYIWLAPSLNNLPVKVEKWKNGELQLTMTLDQAKSPSDKSMEFKSVVNNTEEF